MSDLKPPATVERKDAEAVAPSSHDTGEHPVTKNMLKKALRWNEWLTVIVAVVTACGSLVAGYNLFISRAEAAGSKAAQAAEARASEAKADAAVAIRQGVEVQQDMRALYYVVLTGNRSERLEKPVVMPDGGMP